MLDTWEPNGPIKWLMGSGMVRAEKKKPRSSRGFPDLVKDRRLPANADPMAMTPHMPAMASVPVTRSMPAVAMPVMMTMPVVVAMGMMPMMAVRMPPLGTELVGNLDVIRLH